MHLRELLRQAGPVPDVQGPHQELLLHPRRGVHAHRVEREEPLRARSLLQLAGQLERSTDGFSGVPAMILSETKTLVRFLEVCA